MSNETLFYICGGILAVSALVVTFAGLKLKGFPGKALPIVVLWFALFVGAATTFSVLNAQDEEAAKAAELQEAGEEIEADETTAPFEEEAAETTLDLVADETALAFDKDSLVAKAGRVTIDFTNPSAVPHNVAIEQDGEELAGFEPITESEKSVSAELEPGTYTFLCTVPGHAAAGMEGTLTVE